MNKDRNELLQKVSWALGTLKSAISTMNIGEDLKDCEKTVKQARENAKTQIDRIRIALNELEKAV